MPPGRQEQGVWLGRQQNALVAAPHAPPRAQGVELSLSQVQAVQHLSLRVAAEQCGVGTTQACQRERRNGY